MAFILADLTLTTNSCSVNFKFFWGLSFISAQSLNFTPHEQLTSRGDCWSHHIFQNVPLLLWSWNFYRWYKMIIQCDWQNFTSVEQVDHELWCQFFLQIICGIPLKFFNGFTVFRSSVFSKVLMTTLPKMHENQATQLWQNSTTVESLYLKLSRDREICSR